MVNDKVVPGAYLFSLRVHPDYRRRGIASALVAHASEQVTAEADARVAWAAVAGGNEASLRTFRRAGFDQEREFRLRIAAPSFLPRRQTANITCRPAKQEDLPAVAAALNAQYARHQLWRPLTAEVLALELAAVRCSPNDVMLGLSSDGRLISAASAFITSRAAHLRFLGLRVLPKVFNQLLSFLLSPIPIRFLLVRHTLLPADQPQAVVKLLWCLHRHHLSEAWVLAMALDPLDPAWPAVSRLPGPTARVHFLVRSEQLIEATQPWCLT